MIWIEMSKDEIHGGGNWSFSKCVWAPTYKKSKNSQHHLSSWPFWDNVLKIQDGYIIIHLKGKGDKAAFIGYSIADGNGHKTFEKPPSPGGWAYCKSFYRAFLKDFCEFANPINLTDFFNLHETEIKNYYNQITTSPKNIFFTIQSKHIRCLNGAYFSPADQQLLYLIFNNEINSESSPSQNTVATSEVLRLVKQRLGQSQFADSVKTNYGHQCCFPGCHIDDDSYLVASHIARWADNPSKRGHMDNGLCFCLMHDKAFETGYFSLDNNYNVILTTNPKAIASSFFQKHIAPYSNKQIKLGAIKPGIEAIQEHHDRCGFS